MPRDEEVHEPQDSYEAEEWLAKARLDLAAATRLVSGNPPLTGAAVFHAQQAAEKSWKALLAWHASPFPKTHDLRLLGQQREGGQPQKRESGRRRPLHGFGVVLGFGLGAAAADG